MPISNLTSAFTRGAVLAGSISTVGGPIPLEATPAGNTGVGLNLLSTGPGSAPNTLRFTFDDPGGQPVTVSGVRVALRIFDATGREAPATGEVVNPAAGGNVSVDATFAAPALAGAVGASAPAGAIARAGAQGSVQNQDDELLLPATVVASVNSSGVEGTDDSTHPNLSLDGRSVAFASVAQNLDGPSALDECVPARASIGQPPAGDVYLRDMSAASTQRVSLSSTGQLGNCSSDQPSISGNGRFIAFHSRAGNLAADTNGTVADAFLRDRAPVLTMAPRPFDFGAVKVGTKSGPVSFTISNTGAGPAKLGPTTTAGANPADFSVASDGCSGRTLFTNDTCAVTVTFSPSTIGPRASTLTVNSDAPANPLTDPLTGSGMAAALALSPSPDGFGAVVVGGQASSTLTLVNTGTAPTAIASTAVSGTSAGDYSVSGDLCSGQVLGPSATCTITVRFAPSATGARAASLVVSSDAPGGPVVDALSGTGTQSSGSGVPAIALSPSPDPFGAVPLGTVAHSVITVANSGTAPASISSVALTGPNAGDVAVSSDGCTGSVLAPGAGCQLGVSFSPNAPGDRSAAVSVTDSAAGSPHTDLLTGRGVELRISPSLGDPGSVPTVTGRGWQPFVPVTITWSPGTGTERVIPDAAGNFTMGMLVFRHDDVGGRQVVGADGTTTIKQSYLVLPGSAEPPGLILRR